MEYISRTEVCRGDSSIVEAMEVITPEFGLCQRYTLNSTYRQEKSGKGGVYEKKTLMKERT